MNKRIYILGGGAGALVCIALLFAIMANQKVIRVDQVNIPVAIEAIPETNAASTPTTTDAQSNPLFTLRSPERGTTIESPLTLSGQARGMWFFEGSFPIQLRDANGAVLATAVAQADGEWMTEEFVEWNTVLTWSTASTTATSGTLIFKKDNPSGMPEHDASVEVPVLFKFK